MTNCANHSGDGIALWHNRLPESEDGFRQLGSIRHQGNIAESPRASGPRWRRAFKQSHFGELDSGESFSSEWAEESVYDDHGGAQAPAWDSYADDDQPIDYDEDGWESCAICGTYTDNAEPNDTDTESEADGVEGSPEQAA